MDVRDNVCEWQTWEVVLVFKKRTRGCSKYQGITLPNLPKSNVDSALALEQWTRAFRVAGGVMGVCFLSLHVFF